MTVVLNNKNKKPELLAPAGSMEKLRIALLYGADAVYIGGTEFGLRAYASNFDIAEIAEAAAFAHELGKKVYVTVNIFAHNNDIERLSDYLREIAAAGVDAIIVSDLGVFDIARKTVPELALHISTQANTTNWASVGAWESLGAERVVLARELSLKEIAQIKEKTNIELEVFVHGAMCISYSGRCYLSSYLTGRDGNRGECAQLCRWNYEIIEANSPEQSFSIEEDERGTYIMNSRDLCLLEHLQTLCESGIKSLKIEGRMKSVHYVATVVSVYRKALDEFYRDPDTFSVKKEWREELEKVSHRPYFEGFAVSKPDQSGQVYTSSSYIQTHDFVGIVLEYDSAASLLTIEQRNRVREGEVLEFLQPDGTHGCLILTEMRDEGGEYIMVANRAQQIFTVKTEQVLAPYSLLRRKSI